MKRNHCSLALAALLLAAPTQVLIAQGGNLDEGGAIFLLVPVGGRAAALGQAAVADGGTSESVFWNPAGLAWMTSGEVGVHHAQTFASDNTALSAVFTPHGIGALAFTAYLVDFGSQDVRPLPGGGPVTGRFSPKNIELVASYAANVFNNLAFGINYKLIQFRQDCSGDCGQFPSVAGTTHGFDVGLQYAFGGPNGPLRIGAAIQHAGFRLQLENRDQADPLPTRLQYGFAYTIRFSSPDHPLESLDARLLVDIRNKLDDFGTVDVRVGSEIGYSDLIRLRAGYASINKLFVENEDETGARGPSVGIGLRLGRVAIDFSRIFFDNANFDEPVYIGVRAEI